MLNKNRFVHLRVHSDYSIVDSLIKVSQLVNYANDKKLLAIALTDHNNLCGLIKFYMKANQLGIKAIVGADLLMIDDNQVITSLTLLAMNDVGYKNLIQLISKAYSRGHIKNKVVIDKEWLTIYNQGLLWLSNGIDGELGKLCLQKNKKLYDQYVDFYRYYFADRFYIEVQRTGKENEDDYLVEALCVAQAYQLPIVATNSVVFFHKEDFSDHEVRVCINDGYTLEDNKREIKYTEQQYFRSEAEMITLFSDLPEAIINTVEIAKRCNVFLSFGEYYLPNFPTDGLTTNQYLVKVAHEGLKRRLQFLYPDEKKRAEKKTEYQARLNLELDVINNMGFPGYFLIVMEFIQWAKNNNIAVGPGRGSGAGSLVAYALDITDLDPLAFDLLFERFLNPERISMPDFDIDFCMERRDEVIEHTAQQYGRESVSQIITFGTLSAKAVIRDVGRVLGYPFGFVDRVSKLIPMDIGMTIDKALEVEPDLLKEYTNNYEIKELIEKAKKLEGLTRNAGKHAGGVVIAPGAITDFSPLYCDDEGKNPVTQFDKNDVETVGLVKFDFLGLRTLTIIQWAVEMLNKKLQKENKALVDISLIPLDDTACFQLLQQAKTTAVFQLESAGMKKLIVRLKPDCFEDIIALVALFRPGPLQSGMVDNFINRKHGLEKISYPDEKYQHQSLKHILLPTYGIILYQEQVMQIAQVLSGYSLGGADMLRRAMGKKKPEEMAKQRTIFKKGAIENGVDGELAMKIFDLVEKFAGYGFNKSHSAAYALVSYQTLWLKTHYPAYFMASVLSADMDNTDKVVSLIDECERLKLIVLPPDVNQGDYRFMVNNNQEIVYGLGAIKGIGEGHVEEIVQTRIEKGQFKHFFDFCKKVDMKKLNKRILEKLILSGAFDSLTENKAQRPTREAFFASIEKAIQIGNQNAMNQLHGMTDLFAEEQDTDIELMQAEPWNDKVWLEGEKETLGLYFTGHPICQYLSELSHITQGRLKDITETNNMVYIAGLIIDIRIILTKKGSKMAMLTLDDKSGRMKAVVFSDVYEKNHDIIKKNQIMVFQGTVTYDDYDSMYSMSVKMVFTINQIRHQFAKYFHIIIDTNVSKDTFLKIKSLLTQYAGACPVFFTIKKTEGSAMFKVSDDVRVELDDNLLESLSKLIGNESVSIRY